MFNKISTFLIWSENFKNLANWYKNVLGLKVVEELDHPKDTGVLLEFPEKGCWLWVGQHSRVHGKNKDPYRLMINLDTDSVEKTYQFLIKKKVRIIAKPFKAPTFDKYFCTFSDPEGNTVQVIGPR
jgi:predicted enzyme related to lactoylglutathione lyase